MAELVRNGGFADDSYWDIAGDDWIIISGYAMFQALMEETQDTLSQDLAGLVAGRRYDISFDIIYSNVPSSENCDLCIKLGGTTIAYIQPSVDSYTYNIVAGATGKIEFIGESYDPDENYIFRIDNVSVQEVPIPIPVHMHHKKMIRA